VTYEDTGSPDRPLSVKARRLSYRRTQSVSRKALIRLSDYSLSRATGTETLPPAGRLHRAALSHQTFINSGERTLA
jgi:hypothetical protein